MSVSMPPNYVEILLGACPHVFREGIYMSCDTDREASDYQDFCRSVRLTATRISARRAGAPEGYERKIWLWVRR